ncbi:MAG: hypothetical protein F4X47_10605 [Gammaproteobacteria bacterium]|nr:hypothetical protein [Gammaproteobacteria bacterium]MYC52754.1 hypothetical protein [Gammaproteobacteria bacterium]
MSVHLRRVGAGALGSLLLAFSLAFSVAAQSAPISEAQLEAFRPRSIGPAVTGGRVHDVEALADDPSVLWVATASGGLWRSLNRGHTWVNVFEDMEVNTFGDVALAPSDPRVVYAGTGEQNNRQSTSWGNGIYRSDDGGESWEHLGLEATRHIAEVQVHPRNPDVVYVAASGDLWNASEERGVYRSFDGGRNWRKVLYVDDDTGAIDLVLNHENPDVVYAAMYQRRRTAWGFNGGGPGSGIHRSTDGGDTWEELTEGVPAGDKGRIGLAISRSNPMVLNALIEHTEETGTYRSTDGGDTWEKMSDLNGRPMYYSHIYIDPNDENVVYTLATSSYRSRDGGRTWEDISARPTYDVGVHADKHTMWINPGDPEHFYLAGDAGLHETYDGGVNYRRINNIPIAQFYAIGVDMRDPYWVHGGLQDNHSFAGPSRTRRWAGILNDDWRQTGFGDGMYQQADPRDPRYVYVNSNGGGYVRVDTETGDQLDIRPQPPEGEDRYRFDWVSPSLVSRHTEGLVYTAGNRLFISRDHGNSWTRTEDLTRQVDRDALEIMGVRGTDIRLSRNDGTSGFSEITIIMESPLDGDVLWVGTDDGNVQLSRDGGSTWTELSGNIDGVADGTYVSRILPSVRGADVAYVAFDAHRSGDFAPYVFRTEDAGATWLNLSVGLEAGGSVNSLAEHPDNPELIFAGSEHGLFASTDAGGTWARMPAPTTAYDDLVIHPRDKDLVMGTHGRGILILDDLGALAAWNARVASAPAHLFPIRSQAIFQYWKDTSYRAQEPYAGENPVDGAIITYSLGEGSGSARIVIEDERGNFVRELSVPGSSGVHRVNWDLRHPLPGSSTQWRAHDVEGLARTIEDRGHFVSPGTFRVMLEARGATSEQSLVVTGDPELPVTLAQYREREQFLSDVLALRQEVERVRDELSGRGAGGARGDRIEALNQGRAALAGIYQSMNGGGVRQGSLYPPTATHREQKERVEALLASAREELEDAGGLR